MIQPAMTKTGATNRAIWRVEPTATDKDKSILFFMATVTAVKCSAALPMIGSRMTPVNKAVIPKLSVADSKELTSNSDSIATVIVTTNKIPTQNQRFTSSGFFFGFCWSGLN